MSKLFSFIFLVFSNLLFSQNYAVSAIPENLLHKANAVVRNDETTIDINAIDNMVQTYNKTITILNKSGENFSNIRIPYDKSVSVSNIKVSILDQNGKVIKKYSKSDFTDASHSPSFSFYDDSRILFLNYMSISYPYSIQYSYTTETRNTVFMPDFFPIDGYNISTEKTSLAINNKSGIRLRTKVHEADFAKISFTENGQKYFYSFSNVPAVEDEPRSPSLIDFLPKAEFSLDQFSLEGKKGNLTQWNEFGNWYYQNLINPVSEITPALQAEVAALNLTGSTHEKVKKLFQYMQSKTRYVLVAIGIGGWKPMLVEDVRKKGYGDCKALTNYMRTLLQAAGIKSYYCIITDDRSPIKFSEDFPKMFGNHAILMIPTEKGNIWLENTSQEIAFNHLNYTSLDRNVMAISEDDIKLINTPTYKPEESSEILNAVVQLNPDNSINVDAKFRFSGAQYDFQMPLTTLNKDEVKEALKERFYYLNMENLEANNVTNNRDEALINYEVKLQAKNYSKKLGNDIILRVMPFLDLMQTTSHEDRKLPLEVYFSYQDTYNFSLEIPEGYKLAEVPKSVQLNSEFGNYSLQFSMENGKLVTQRKITILKNIYPKEKFKEYIEFRKKTNNLDNTKILLTKI